jgi:8-oxo-dGTP pyrophosphatase MutT (NUDIX family)
MSRTDVIRQLKEYRQRHPSEFATIDRFEAFVGSEPHCFQRNCWAGHVTGSAWIVNAQQTHVLLTHHKKLNRWLQLGGHSDGDSDPLRVACREAEEESGLAVAPVSIHLFDIDIHLIPARKNDPAHHHFDARYALHVVSSDAFRVSDESHALRWVKVDEIGALTSESSMLRMARKWLDRGVLFDR